MVNFSVSLTGLDQAASTVDKTAAKLAKGVDAAGSGDLAEEMVMLLQAKIDAEANIRALQTQDDITQSTFEIFG